MAEIIIKIISEISLVEFMKIFLLLFNSLLLNYFVDHSKLSLSPQLLVCFQQN